jgi:peptide/nickel transport system substrate-binding protein
MTRRRLLGGAVAAGAGLVIAGCGGSGGSGGSGSATAATSTTAEPKVGKRGGTFRFGTVDGSTSDSIDPLQGNATETNDARTVALYDTLLYMDHQFNIQPSLALSCTANKAVDRYTLELRKGVTFHDGKPFTADDVIATFKRIFAPKSGATGIGTIGSIDPSRIKKLGSHVVQLDLRYPDVGLPAGLTQPGNAITPVGFDPKKPNGTGPFVYQSFTPGVRSVFVRNENYWRNGQPYLDQLEIIDFTDPTTARVNALLSEQIDGANQLLPSFVPELKGHQNIAYQINPGGSCDTLEMRMDIPPFNDVRVRQAMRLIADRPQIVQNAYSGYARIGNDWPSPQDPTYDHSIPQRVQDIEQAKHLLKQAGRSDLNVTLYVSPVSPGLVSMAQVLAEQAKSAAVTINVSNVTDEATYYSKYYYQAPFKFNFFSTLTIWQMVGYSLLPNSPYLLSKWHDPHWTKLVTTARGTADASKRNDLMHEAQKIFWESGTWLINAFYDTIDAYSTKFTGFHKDISGNGLNGLYFNEISLA